MTRDTKEAFFYFETNAIYPSQQNRCDYLQSIERFYMRMSRKTLSNAFPILLPAQTKRWFSREMRAKVPLSVLGFRN